MMIRNLEQRYLVIQKIEDTDGADQYLCRNADFDSDREYRIARLSLPMVGGDLVRFLMEQIHQENFTDFVDYFTDADYLYVVMNCGRGNTLGQKLRQENCKLNERMEISKNLLEKAVLLDMPSYFLYGVMREDGIRVAPTLEVGFDYEMNGLAQFDQIEFVQAQRRIGEILELLLARELELEALPAMKTMIYGLKHGEYEDLLKVHEAFLLIYYEWDGKSEQALSPQSFSFRLWARIKKLGSLAKKAVYAGILLLALAYLVITVKEMNRPAPIADTFEKIGTLQIR